MEAAWSGWPPGAVRRWPNEQSSDIPRMLKGSRFGGGDSTGGAGTARSGGGVARTTIEAARRIVGWKGVLANAQQEIALEPYFRAVYVASGSHWRD